MLFEELDAFDERWRLKYATLYDAAEAAGALDLYSSYMATREGHNRPEPTQHYNEDMRLLE